MEANFRVRFAGAPITVEAARALDEMGLTLRASYGGGVVPPGGALPEPTNHSVYLRADTGQDALDHVQEALKGHGPYVAFDVEPFGSDEPTAAEVGGADTLQLGREAELEALGETLSLSAADQARDWRRRWEDTERGLRTV